MSEVSYRHFIEKATELRKQAEDGFSFLHMLQEPVIAILLGGILFCLFVFILAMNFDKTTKQFSWLFRKLQKENVDSDFPIVFLTVLTSFVFCSILFGVSWYALYDEQVNINKGQINTYYQAYMKTQEDAKYPIVEIITDKESMRNKTIHEDKESYIFDDLVCSNCMIKEVAYRNEKKGDWYRATVILSYSLEPGVEPYMIVKPQIRESIAHIESSGLYNPIIYLPKSDGREKP